MKRPSAWDGVAWVRTVWGYHFVRSDKWHAQVCVADGEQTVTWAVYAPDDTLIAKGEVHRRVVRAPVCLARNRAIATLAAISSEEFYDASKAEES